MGGMDIMDTMDLDMVDTMHTLIMDMDMDTGAERREKLKLLLKLQLLLILMLRLIPGMDIMDTMDLDMVDTMHTLIMDMDMDTGMDMVIYMDIVHTMVILMVDS